MKWVCSADTSLFDPHSKTLNIDIIVKFGILSSINTMIRLGLRRIAHNVKYGMIFPLISANMSKKTSGVALC
jgi:hypothetical protein